MRLLRFATILLLSLPALLPLLAANVPLVLSASADREVLLARRLPTRQTTDALNYEIEQAKVTLTFTNTGDTPLKLNTYVLLGYHLQLAIHGPDAQSVVQEKYSPEMEFAQPGDKDYPVLQPGGSWTLAAPLSFPDQEFSFIRYQLRRTGTYHLRFLYTFVPNKAAPAHADPLAQGAFQGVVASNNLTIKLVEASDPVKGLQMALDPQPSPDPMSGDVTLTAYLRNVSEKPIIINSWDLDHAGLQFTGDDGKLLQFSGGNYRSRVATRDERYTTIAPGEKHAFSLRGRYRPDLETLDTQRGNFGIEDNTGSFRNWPLQGSAARAYAVLDMPDTPVEQVTDAPGPLWIGKVTAPAVAIPLNPTAYRQAKLKQEVAHFALALDYSGKQDKPYYTLRLQVEPVVQDAASVFNPVVQLTDTEAAALIDDLAKDGLLRDATPIVIMPEAGTRLPPSGYTLTISGNINIPAGTGDRAYWSLFLGFDLKMYRQLQALRAPLPQGAQAKMDLLLARLSGEHDLWAAEDALRQPAVTLDTPAGSLEEAAKAIHAVLPDLTLKLTIDPTTGAIHVPAFHFFNVSAGYALQVLAEAADVNYTQQGETVVFQALVK